MLLTLASFHKIILFLDLRFQNNYHEKKHSLTSIKLLETISTRATTVEKISAPTIKFIVYLIVSEERSTT